MSFLCDIYDAREEPFQGTIYIDLLKKQPSMMET